MFSTLIDRAKTMADKPKKKIWKKAVEKKMDAPKGKASIRKAKMYGAK